MKSWRVDDKEWMENRKQEWEKKEKSLKYAVDNKNTLNQFKNYYLKGKLAPNSVLDLFDKLWMHPEQNEKTWKRLCDEDEVCEYIGARAEVLYKSYLGYMDGIDVLLFKYFYKDEHIEGTFKYKAEDVNIAPCKPESFFNQWRRRANIWLTEALDNEDCVCSCSINYWFSCLPYIPEEYFDLNYYSEPEDYYSRKIRQLRTEIRQSHRLLYYIAWFAEPRGLQGEVTKVRQFAEKMKKELDSRKLSPAMEKLWNFIKTDEACYLNVIKNNDTMNYWSVVLHSDKPVENQQIFMRNIQSTFGDLGFCDEVFDLNKIEKVELNKHLSAKFVLILGYNKGESISGFRYRIKTTERYINNSRDRIDKDVIIFSHPKGFEFKEDTPVAMLVPRPNDNYDLTGSRYYQGKIYELNYRLVRRTLDAKIGYNFKRYDKFEYTESSRLSEEANPFVDVSYKPLKNGFKALLNNVKKDFSPFSSVGIDSSIKPKPAPSKKKKTVKDETGVLKKGIDTTSLLPLFEVKKELTNESMPIIEKFKLLIDLCEHHGIYISDEIKNIFKSPELILKRLKSTKYDYVEVESTKDLDYLTFLEKLYVIIPMRFHFEHNESLDACEEEEIKTFYPDFFKSVAKATMGEWEIKSIRKKVIGEIDSYDCKINLKLSTGEKQFSFTYNAGAGEFDTKCVKDAVNLTGQLLSGRLVVDWYSSDSHITMAYLPKPMADIIEKMLK